MSQSAPSASSPAAQPTFEAALAELEQVVRDLEDGELGLSESLGRYEVGVKRLRECYELLERAERRIELLTAVDANGVPKTQPFDDTATIDAPPKSNRRRKSPPAVTPPQTESEDGVDSAEGLF